MLYVLMLALPVTGLMLVADHAVGGLTQLNFGLSFPVIPVPIPHELRSWLAWCLIWLLGLHILAALKLQVMDGPIVSRRMSPFGAAPHRRR
jgi:cytochrome b561